MLPSCSALTEPVKEPVISTVLTLASDVAALVRISLGSVSAGACDADDAQAARTIARMATSAASGARNERRDTDTPQRERIDVASVTRPVASCQTAERPIPTCWSVRVRRPRLQCGSGGV